MPSQYNIEYCCTKYRFKSFWNYRLVQQHGEQARSCGKEIKFIIFNLTDILRTSLATFINDATNDATTASNLIYEQLGLWTDIINTRRLGKSAAVQPIVSHFQGQQGRRPRSCTC